MKIPAEYKDLVLRILGEYKKETGESQPVSLITDIIDNIKQDQDFTTDQENSLYEICDWYADRNCHINTGLVIARYSQQDNIIKQYAWFDPNQAKEEVNQIELLFQDVLQRPITYTWETGVAPSKKKGRSIFFRRGKRK